jgi:hypothetical protein
MNSSWTARSKSPQALWPKRNTDGARKNCQSQTATKKSENLLWWKSNFISTFMGGDGFVQSKLNVFLLLPYLTNTSSERSWTELHDRLLVEYPECDWFRFLSLFLRNPHLATPFRVVPGGRKGIVKIRGWLHRGVHITYIYKNPTQQTRQQAPHIPRFVYSYSRLFGIIFIYLLCKIQF